MVPNKWQAVTLTNDGRVMHIWVGKLYIIGSDNGLSPGRRQAIIWTKAGLLLTGSLGTNFNEILSKILTFSFKKICLNVSSAKWWPFCLGLNVLTNDGLGCWWYMSLSLSELKCIDLFLWLKWIFSDELTDYVCMHECIIELSICSDLTNAP